MVRVLFVRKGVNFVPGAKFKLVLQPYFNNIQTIKITISILK